MLGFISFSPTYRAIPASAGETVNRDASGNVTGAYPRERGGNLLVSYLVLPLQGLSPRARGKRPSSLEHGGCNGPIPASAGETLAQLVHNLNFRAYPRERGGNCC